VAVAPSGKPTLCMLAFGRVRRIGESEVLALSTSCGGEEQALVHCMHRSRRPCDTQQARYIRQAWRVENDYPFCRAKPIVNQSAVMAPYYRQLASAPW